MNQTTPKRSGTAVSTATTRRRRPWLRWVVMALPLLWLAGLEAGLRLAGYGYPTAFFLSGESEGRRVLESNPRFGWRFFPPAVARTPQPLRVAAEKPATTWRVVVLGESAAMGDPEPAYGLPRVLEVMLQECRPTQKVEVINAAATAINSHVIREIARDCRGLQAEAWVIYAGNNEVVGPFGAGTVFGPRGASLALIRASLAARRLKCVQAGEALRRRLWDHEPQSWEGMELFLEQRVPADAPGLERVYAHFERNMRDILAEARRAGAQVFLCTVGVNVRDCAPLASVHRPPLAPEAERRFDACLRAAEKAMVQTNYAGALEQLEAALGLSPHHAAALFLRGHCHAALGREEQARKDWAAALQEDALRFRADARVNQILRKLAAELAPQGVTLVDVEALLAQASPQQAPGREFFWEHVHFNFEGNYTVAAALAKALLRRNGLPSRETVAARLALTDFDRHQVTEQVLRRLEQPPFTGQWDNAAQRKRLEAQLEAWRPRLTPQALREQAAVHAEALARRPEDWVLYARRAESREAAGELEGARQDWERVRQLLPHYGEALFRLGNLADKQGQPEVAEPFFRQALRLRPESAEAWNGLGLSLLAQQRWAEAEAAFQTALRWRPRFVAAKVNWALALQRQERLSEALEHFYEALQMDPQHLAVRVNLGKCLKQMGRMEAALAHYRRAVELHPQDAVARFNLANTLAELRQTEAALREYAAVVEAAPEMIEARLNYGLELARAGRENEAFEQLQEVARRVPQSYEARLNYGVALARRRQWVEAREEFAAAAALRPKEPAPWLNLGMVLARMNLRQAAREAFEAALRVDPQNPVARQQLEQLQQR
ncbi:tetratricopeptide repeat protein [Fontisphaera persica]|uniref:tetratricopeptide repeat protein n=1 Tax=Fontisphaera persica TaxID=2974023 RepID=UPI0024BF18EA|nr:tetratricopeptide repeat protein [Fontisphaera persica]WCJ58848.1 tetratricopeptide repeat protein [Fontisphaera persica]